MLSLGYVGWGQTNPTAFDLSTGSFTFTGFAVGTTTTYPASMQGWKFAAEPTTPTTNAPSADFALSASSTTITTGSIRNEVANGISILNSGSNNLGAIVIAVNTTGRSDVKVTFTALQTTDGTTRINALRLQYRIGTSGTFTDVTPITEYLTTLNGTNTAQTFTDVVLPSSIENQSNVQIRWIYYAYSGSGTRDRIRLDEITISSSVAANATPTVTTQAVSSIGATTATGNGNITATGGVNPTKRGFCWGLATGSDPDTTSSFNHNTETGNFGTGAFTGSIATGLSPNTQYKVRAYATNTIGVAYGSVVTFTTLSNEPTNQATSFTATTNSQTSITTSWNDNDGIQTASGFLVMANLTGTFTDPVDGTAQTDDSDLSDGSGKVNVTHGTQSFTWNNGLSAGTMYYFKIFPYNGSGTAINYKTDGTVPITNATTSASLDATSEVSGPVLSSQPNPTIISSLVTTNVAAVRVFDMDIYDYATSDAQPTKITQVTIKAGTNNTADWSTTIQGVKLSTDAGSTFVTIGTPTITTSSIVIPITSGNLNVPNGNALTVSLYVYLKSTGLVDNQVMEFKVDATASSHGFVADATGSTFISTFASAPVSNQILIDVVATKLNFSTQPSNTTVNTNFSVAVEALDANNNRDLNATTSVTLNSSAGTLSSTTGLTQNLVAGVYTWSDLQNNTAGTGVTLSANGTLTTATSNSFTIYAVQPTVQASAILFSNVGINTMTVSWTNGNGTNRIVVVKASGAPSTPSNGISYAANSVYGLGGTIATNEYVVYNGTGNTVDVSGLSGSTSYTFKVFEYNGNSGTENYLTTSNATTQTTNGLTYYSNGSGDPAVLTNWKTSRDGSGSSPSNFTLGEIFVIENGDNMSTTTTWAISGMNSKLEIENGGTLTANNAITLSSATTFQIDNGGTYIQNVAMSMSSSIFQGIEVFASGSNIEIRIMPSGTSAPSSPGWGNLTINQTTGSSALGWSGNLSSIQGNLTILGTGSGTTRHAFTGNPTISMSIGGNFTVTGGNLWLSSGSGSCTVNVGGNLIINGGTLDLANSSGIGTINVGGNVTVSSGTLTEGGSTTTSKIVFNKSGTQTFTSGGTISNIVNFEVTNGSITDLGTNVISGAGAFTLSSGATLITANTSGLDGSVTVSGTKTLSTAANYEFNGTFEQVTGALLPTTINNLIIDNTAGVKLSNSALTVGGNLTINSGKLFTIDAGKSLTVSGVLTNSAGNSGLVIEDGASLITNGTVSGGATVKRTFTGPAWHLMSAPVDGQSVFTGYTDMYYYDETQALWVNHNGGSWNGGEPSYLPGKGYLVSWASGATKEFAGTLHSGDYATGSGSVPALTYTSGKGNGFNLVGNPYPSAINGSSSWTKTNVDNSIWVYDNGNYLTWNGSTGTLTGGIIPAMQGFWVKANAGGPSLTIPNSARTASAQAYYKESVQDMLHLQVDGNGYRDGIVVNMNDEATTGYDHAFDVFKMYGDQNAPQMYSLASGSELSINVLPHSTQEIIVPVALKVGQNNSYTISVKENTFNSLVGILLEDVKTNNTINLWQVTSYTFTANPNDDPQRFKLHFNGATGINEPSASPFSIYTNSGIIYVNNSENQTLKGTVTVYSVTGQAITTRSLSGDRLQKLSFNGKPGCYIVKVTTDKGVYSQKIIL
jgi:hypothetical protein